MSHRPVSLACAFALLAAACGGGDGGAETADVADATSGTTSASASADDPTTTAAADDTTTTAAAPEPAFPRTVTDALGTEFVLDGPARIGCVWTGCDEIHATLGVVIGAGAVVDGFEDTALFYPLGPPEFIPSSPADVEAWAGADIDFVLSRIPENPLLRVVQDVVNVFYLHHPAYGESTSIGFDAYLDNLELVGSLLGRDAEAATAVARLEGMIEQLAAASTPESATRTVAILFPGEEYSVVGDENPFCDVLARTGIGTCLDVVTGELSAEAFLAADPDWIVYQGGAGVSADRDDPTWGRLSAVAAGQVIESGFRQYYCCGDRTLLYALQEYVSVTLPELGVAAPGPVIEFDPSTSPLLP